MSRSGASLAAAVLLTGCATLVSGTHQEVHFESDPPGAVASVRGVGAVRTPGSLKVERSRAHEVTFVADGYQATTVPLEREVNPVVMGNVFCGILPGLLVDFLVGGAFRFDPAIRVTLEPLADDPPSAE